MGPFRTLNKRALLIVGIDNINKRSRHQLAIHEQMYTGFDRLVEQAINPDENFDFLSYYSEQPVCNLLPIPLDHSSLNKNREQFIMETFTSQDDCDVTAFRYLVCCLAISQRDAITSEDEKFQRSFRYITLNAVKGFRTGKLRVEYVEARRCNPNNPTEIVDTLERIESVYNPKGTCLTQRDFILVAVHGDQPIFNQLFLMWFESYVSWVNAGAPDEVDFNANNLFRWIFPLPGGFHIDKQGMIPMIKEFLSGTGLEELIKFSGLTPSIQSKFMSFGQYRGNHRVLVQVMVAMLLRLDDSVTAMSTNFAAARERYLKNIRAWDDGTREIRCNECQSSVKQVHKSRLKEVLSEGTQLGISENVSSSVLKLGKAFVDEMHTKAKSSPNMEFYGRVALLQMLIPWFGFNILARRGQTLIMDKFYFVFVEMMHRTRKLNYMENTLFYGLVKRVIPRVLHDTL